MKYDAEEFQIHYYLIKPLGYGWSRLGTWQVLGRFGRRSAEIIGLPWHRGFGRHLIWVIICVLEEIFEKLQSNLRLTLSLLAVNFEDR